MNAKLEATWRCPYCINRKIHPCPHTAENWRRECYDSAAPTTGTTTKTTRELLELAAKASGLTTTHKWNAERLLLDPPVLAMVVHRDGELVTTGWNPRDDDGDSRRLEVKLKIQVEHNRHDVCAFAFGKVYSEDYGIDPCAATRLAVLRAAAAIGEAMP